MFQLRFEDDNAAFEDGDPEECARILKHVADEVRGGSLGGLVDGLSNGTATKGRVT